MPGPDNEREVEVLSAVLETRPPQSKRPTSSPGSVGNRVPRRALGTSASSPALPSQRQGEKVHVAWGGGAAEDGGRPGALDGSWLASPGAASAPSRPGTSPSRPCSSPARSRPGTGHGSGRFLADELNCFKRVPTPSKGGSFETKQDVYWQTSGELRRHFSEQSLHQLPVNKGNFFSHPKLKGTFGPNYNERTRAKRDIKRVDKSDAKAEPLPEEEATARVLNELFPYWHSTDANAETLSKTRRLAGATSTPVSLNSSPEKGRIDFRKRSLGGGDTGDMNRSPQLGQQDAYDAETLYSQTPLHGTHTRGTSPGSNPAAHTLSGANTGTVRTLGLAFGTGTPEHHAMLHFRKQCIDRFTSINDTVEAFKHHMPAHRDLTKKEWRRFLSKHCEWLDKEDRDLIIKQLNFERFDGHLPISEFHIAVEASAPVKTFEGLRRRWLASGFASMRQALNQMDDNGARSMERLTHHELGEMLARVYVHDPAEHYALFGQICSSRNKTVSIAELASAVASVSPQLLLEDLRDKMLKKYHGNLENAFRDLDVDRDATIEKNEFLNRGHRRLGIPEDEARKAFREIDIDSDGSITRYEFIAAIALCEPSLFLEDIRLKVRQRFRSIEDLFAKAFNENAASENQYGEIANKKCLHVEQFVQLLSTLDLKETETRILFELFDTDQSGDLTVAEFVKGIRHFAPSCVLEDLRIRCCEKHQYIGDAFAAWEDKQKLLDVDQFTQMLVDLELLTKHEVEDYTQSMARGSIGGPSLFRRSLSRGSRSSSANPLAEQQAKMQRESICTRRTRFENRISEDALGPQDSDDDGGHHRGRIRIQHIFDLLDTRNAGAVSVGMLVAALQSCGAGARAKPSTDERDLDAKEHVKQDMAPKRKLAGDIRSQLRFGLDWKDDRQAGVSTPTAQSPTGAGHMKDMDVGVWEKHGKHISEMMAMRTSSGSPFVAPQSPGTPSAEASSPTRAGRVTRAGTSGRPGGDKSFSAGHVPHGSRNTSPDSPAGGRQGERGQTPGGAGLDQEDPAQHHAESTTAPRLRTKPVEELDEHSRLQARHMDISKPSHMAVACAQKSWENLWRTLRNNTAPSSKGNIEKLALNYYQTAALTLSQDTPLVQGSFSKASFHRKMADHGEALKPSQLKANARKQG